jgi:hypothetical protein
MIRLLCKKVKKREELERCFLSAVLAEDIADTRQVCAVYEDKGLTWRHFKAKEHQAVWRALCESEFPSHERRVEILLSEMTPEELDEQGEPGSAAWKGFLKQLGERSSNLAWLERELDAAGALPFAGGKAYLRELAGAYPVPVRAEDFAKELWEL